MPLNAKHAGLQCDKLRELNPAVRWDCTGGTARGRGGVRGGCVRGWRGAVLPRVHVGRRRAGGYRRGGGRLSGGLGGGGGEHDGAPRGPRRHRLGDPAATRGSRRGPRPRR